MITYTVYSRLTQKSIDHLKLVMSAAPIELHPENMTAPHVITSTPIDPADLQPGPLFGVPVGFRTVYSAYTASTHLILELDSPVMNTYTVGMLKKYGGIRSMYYDTVDYPHLLFKVAPPFSRKQRGWIANMSTTLAQSSPQLEFMPPEVEQSSM